MKPVILLSCLLLALPLAALLTTRNAEANLSARYGTGYTGYLPSGQQYITILPRGYRMVYDRNRRLYLVNQTYYEPYMLYGQVVYVRVGSSFEARMR